MLSFGMVVRRVRVYIQVLGRTQEEEILIVRHMARQVELLTSQVISLVALYKVVAQREAIFQHLRIEGSSYLPFFILSLIYFCQ